MTTIEIIIELINKHFKSEAEFERALGLKSKIVYGWKAGRSKSYYEYIPQMCELFNVDANYLLCVDSTKAPQLSAGAYALADTYDYVRDFIKQDLTDYAGLMRTKENRLRAEEAKQEKDKVVALRPEDDRTVKAVAMYYDEQGYREMTAEERKETEIRHAEYRKEIDEKLDGKK